MFWSNWAGPFWNADVVKYLTKEWKISLLRCPVGVSNDNGPVKGGYLSDPSGNKARLVTVVDAAIEAGIYVIIDWHVEGQCNAEQSKPFFAERPRNMVSIRTSCGRRATSPTAGAGTLA